MHDGDQILRAYATITSIRDNVPERHEVEERWVIEFNAAIERLEKSLKVKTKGSGVFSGLLPHRRVALV